MTSVKKKRRRAVVEQAACVACGCCVRVCPLRAIEIVRGVMAQVDGEKCVGCGKCAAVCVENNIRLRDGRPVWGDRCTHCMACICGCPAGAIEYGRASRGKPRYQCPEYREE